MKTHSLQHPSPLTQRCKPEWVALSRLDGVCARAGAVRARKNVGLFEYRPTPTHHLVGRWSETPTNVGQTTALASAMTVGGQRRTLRVPTYGNPRPTHTHTATHHLVGRRSETPTHVGQTAAYASAMTVGGQRRTLRVPTYGNPRPTHTHTATHHHLVGRRSETPTNVGQTVALASAMTVGGQCRTLRVPTYGNPRPTHTATHHHVGRWSKTPTNVGQTVALASAMTVNGQRRTLRVPTYAVQLSCANPSATPISCNTPQHTPAASHCCAALN